MNKMTTKYVQKDYASLKAGILGKITQFVSEWTDHNESDFGIAIIELDLFLRDNLHYYLDMAALEAFLPTARQRSSVIRHCNLIDYYLSLAEAATVDLTFSIADPLNYDVVIPAGSYETQGDNPLTFEVPAQTLLQAGQTSVTMTATEGKFRDEKFTSTGSKDQEITLTYKPLIKDSLRVYVADKEWTIAESLFDKYATDQACEVRVDGDDTIKVVFGDADYGAIPSKDSGIKITYRTGGGLQGRIGAGAIDIKETFLDTIGNPVEVRVTNLAGASGGKNKEASEFAKRFAPRSLRALRRAVNESDFETLAVLYNHEAYGAVARAYAARNATTGHFENLVDIYVCAVDADNQPAAAGVDLKAALEAYLNTLDMLNVAQQILDMEILERSIAATVHLQSNYSRALKLVECENALKGFYGLNNPDGTSNRESGSGLRLSDIYGVLEGVEGVDYADVSTPSANEFFQRNQIFKIASITLTMQGGIA